MCVKVPWMLTCGCEEPHRSTLIKCPIALAKNLEHCEGLETASPILGDVPCKKCAALVGLLPELSIQEVQEMYRDHSENASHHCVTRLEGSDNASDKGLSADLYGDYLVNTYQVDSDNESIRTLKAEIRGSATDKMVDAMQQVTIAGDPQSGDQRSLVKTGDAEIPRVASPVPATIHALTTGDNKCNSLPLDSTSEEIRDPSDKETLTEAVEKIVEFIEETRNVEITHHDTAASRTLGHGESMIVSGIVALDDDTSVEVNVKVTKE